MAQGKKQIRGQMEAILSSKQATPDALAVYYWEKGIIFYFR